MRGMQTTSIGAYANDQILVKSRTMSSNIKGQYKLEAVMLGHDNHPQPRNDNCESPSYWSTIVSRKQIAECTGVMYQVDLTSAVASGQRLRGGSEIYIMDVHVQICFSTN